MPFEVNTETENKLDFVCSQASGGFDLWADFTTSMYDVEPMESASNTGHFEARAYSCERGALISASYDRQFFKTLDKQTRDSANIVFVLRILSGGVVGHSEDAPLLYRPGVVVINDYARQYGGIMFASNVQCVFLDKAQLGLDPSDQRESVGKCRPEHSSGSRRNRRASRLENGMVSAG